MGLERDRELEGLIGEKGAVAPTPLQRFIGHAHISRSSASSLDVRGSPPLTDIGAVDVEGEATGLDERLEVVNRRVVTHTPEAALSPPPTPWGPCGLAPHEGSRGRVHRSDDYGTRRRRSRRRTPSRRRERRGCHSQFVKIVIFEVYRVI